MTVNPALRAREVAHVLGQSRAHGVVLAPAYRGADLAGTLAQVRGDLPGLREVISLADWDSFAGSGSPAERLPQVGPDDAAQIQYTSGTTGFPKGAVLRHRGITNNARFCAEILQADAGEVWVNPMPLFHTAGCVLLTLGPVQHLFTQVLVPGFDPGLVLHVLESERGTMFGGVPTMLLALLDHPAFGGTDLSSVRFAFAGGATVPPDLVRRVESVLGVPFSITFAQTEASPCITQTRLDDAPDDRAGTLGRPHPQVEVMIADPATGQQLPAGTIGEILTRGYHVMKEYFGDPVATGAAIDAAGWLHTGDLGSADERGYYRIEGRVKEMIIRGGENIYPREIEQLRHAYRESPTWPWSACPTITGASRWPPSSGRPPGRPSPRTKWPGDCRSRLAAHKTPRHWVFTDAFPMTGYPARSRSSCSGSSSPPPATARRLTGGRRREPRTVRPPYSHIVELSPEGGAMPGDTEPAARRTIDTSVAHSARVHDYWLGGKDNFAADRAAGDAVIAAYPGIVMSVRANRAFLARAVRSLATEAGIRQFLDIGTGIPASNNTHEVAQSVAPSCRVVYVGLRPGGAAARPGPAD